MVEKRSLNEVEVQPAKQNYNIEGRQKMIQIRDETLILHKVPKSKMNGNQHKMEWNSTPKNKMALSKLTRHKLCRGNTTHHH